MKSNSQNLPYINSLDFLKSEFQSRQKRNSRYSLRSFAKAVQLSPSFISLVLSGQKKLGYNAALKISQKLKFNNSKKDMFLSLIELDRCSDSLTEIELAKKLKVILKKEISYKRILDNQFELLSKWYYNAILTLISSKSHFWTALHISQKLGLSVPEVTKALNILESQDLVFTDNNTWTSTNLYFEIHDQPSKAIREYHKSILKMAQNSIDQLPTDKRIFTTMVLNFPRNKIDEFRQKVNAFYDEISLLSQDESQTEIVQLSVNLFPLHKTLTEDSHD